MLEHSKIFNPKTCPITKHFVNDLEALQIQEKGKGFTVYPS